MLTADQISSLVRQELDHITDPTLLNQICELLVTPYPVEQDWDYGDVGERFTCWTVLEHPGGLVRLTLEALYFYQANTWELEWIAVGSRLWNQLCAKAWRGTARIQRITKSL